MRRSVWLLVLLVLPCGVEAQQREGADTKALRTVYGVDTPVLTVPFRLVNSTGYPAFALAPLGVYAAEGEWEPTVRMVAAEGTAAVLALSLKRVIKRPRPYQTLEGIRLRTDALDEAVLAHDDYAMPSGHATLAFTIAASWTLERPVWYVAVPAYAWAGLVGVSRVWHGAHYPSDVLAGAALGTGTALLVHALWPGDGGDTAGAPLPVTLRIAF